MKRSDFARVYAEELRKEIGTPGFWIPSHNIEEAAYFTTMALAAGTVWSAGPAVERTCERLGIAYDRQALIDGLNTVETIFEDEAWQIVGDITWRGHVCNGTLRELVRQIEELGVESEWKHKYLELLGGTIDSDRCDDYNARGICDE